MKILQILLPILFIGGALMYGRAAARKRAAAMPAAIKSFLERTGYRYAELVGAPIEQHVARGQEVFANTGKGYQAHLVRDAYGMPVHNFQEGSVTKDGAWATSYSWATPLPHRPRALFQLADRSLTGMGKAVKEAFSNTRREWQAVYPHEVAIPDPDLARKMVCFAEDPAAAARALAMPGLKELLLGCAEVDLVVAPGEVRFSDPFQKNLLAGMGGTMGAMAAGNDVARVMDLQIPIHDRIAELLAVTARACS